MRGLLHNSSNFVLYRIILAQAKSNYMKIVPVILDTILFTQQTRIKIYLICN